MKALQNFISKASFLNHTLKIHTSMKKIYTSLLLSFLFSHSNVSAQVIEKPCGQAEITNAWFQKHPELKKKYEDAQSAKANFINPSRDNGQRADSIIYTIPLVFHILHLDGPENISDEQIFDQVAILNRDYQKRNADTSLIDSPFVNNIANVGFAFKLATIDPDGNCTNGITRHYTTKTTWDVNNLNDFIYSWPTNEYLNIYVVTKLNINATAYSFLPGVGVPDYADVIVTTHKMVGSIGTATVANSRVLTHEVAHWFDIQHTWGSSNAPGVACGDDLIQDTPETKGFSTCNIANSNVCNPTIFENVQNYMDYSPCKIMFTNGQADRMYATIASGINNRDNMFTSANQLATGMIGNVPCYTKADFYATKTTNCVGNTLTFKSVSQFGNAPGTLSWSFPGGVPSSSTDTIAVVSYPNAGTYDVALTAISTNGTDNETKNNFVKIIDGSDGLILPFTYNFEDTSLPANIVVINQEQDTVLWKHNKTVGADSTNHCIFLHNFPDSTNYDYTDWFETPFFDFSNTTNATLSYYYAYAKRYATQADSFKVQYTLDCGGSWTSITNIPNTNAMATNSGGTSAGEFIPTSIKWKKVTVPPNRLTALNYKPSVKFRFHFKTDYYVDGANNFYLDEINLTGDVVSSVSESEILNGMTIYPNPSNGSLILEFLSPENAETKLELFDATGRLHEQTALTVSGGTIAKHTINASQTLSPGIYLAVISINNQKLIRKIILTNN